MYRAFNSAVENQRRNPAEDHDPAQISSNVQRTCKECTLANFSETLDKRLTSCYTNCVRGDQDISQPITETFLSTQQPYQNAISTRKKNEIN
jgi:hypothetical protein